MLYLSLKTLHILSMLLLFGTAWAAPSTNGWPIAAETSPISP